MDNEQWFDDLKTKVSEFLETATCEELEAVLSACKPKDVEIERLQSEQCQAYSCDGKCDLVESLKAEIERLNKLIDLAASQKYCTMCGETLDGYVPSKTEAHTGGR